jgi:uncharacterized protein (TIGR02145 family)
MRKKTIFRTLALFMMSAASLHAQVIIGSLDEPHVAAGLDLSPLGDKKLGLLLPNVELKNNAADLSLVDGATDEQKNTACGLIVFNNDAHALDGTGLYVWDGTQWQTIAATPPPENYSIVTDVDGDTYEAAFFGKAGWWMTENLRTKKDDVTLNGDPGTDPSNKYTCPPSSNPAIVSTFPAYGSLYTWAAATGRTGISVNEENIKHTKYQGICPDGWHLPNDYEWGQLEKEIATNPGKYSSRTNPYTNAGNYNYGGTTEWRPGGNPDDTYWGRQMKSTTPVDGESTDGTSNSKTANGFDALLVGGRDSNAAVDYGEEAIFWTSSSNSATEAWVRRLAHDKSGVKRVPAAKYSMFSVRCKKD